MGRIDEIFHDAGGRTVLMPFVTAGHPSLEVTRDVIPALAEAGAGIVEVGIPFSDPIADGPVIAAAMHEALGGGVTPLGALGSIADARAGTDVGIMAMVSDSIVARMGPQTFVGACAEAGVDGLIVPDIDTRDAAALRALTDAAGMAFALLVAPTTPEPRVKEIVALCSGFVYVLARAGVTGESSGAPQVAQRVEVIRRHTKLPLAVGFGISKAEHVRAAAAHCEGVIVGSALVRRMGEASDPVAAARALVADLSRQ